MRQDFRVFIGNIDFNASVADVLKIVADAVGAVDGHFVPKPQEGTERQHKGYLFVQARDQWMLTELLKLDGTEGPNGRVLRVSKAKQHSTHV